MKSNPRIALAAATAASALVAVTTQIASHAADPSPFQQANNTGPVRVGCLHFSGGHASYAQDPPKNPRLPHTTYTYSTGALPISVAQSGDQQDGVSAQTPSCPGVVYELQIRSTDGSSLQYSGAQTSLTAAGPATITANDKGDEVDIDWVGDGQTASFSASVTTGWKYAPGAGQCLDTRFHVVAAGQDVTDPGYGYGTVCYDPNGSPGFSYTG